MDMKNLHQFTLFDWDAFANGKYFKCIGLSKWTEFKTKAELGTKVQVVIIKDDTSYKPFNDGSPAPNNLYEKFDFKISKALKDVTVNVGDMVIPVNPIAKPYSLSSDDSSKKTKQNQLSVKADDVKVLQPKKGA